jgi:sugar lactone lactonase YvrE
VSSRQLFPASQKEMPPMPSSRTCRRLSFALTVTAALSLMCAAARAQAVPSPNTSVYAGSPQLTFGGNAAAICTAANGDLDALGNGCLASAAHLDQPFGTAIDSYNNIYTADASYYDGQVRVIYQGGTALAAALVASNPAKTFTPTAGHIYGFGTLTGTGNQTLTTAGAYCSGTSGPKTYDTLGDGCPAAYGVFTARDVFVDANGNIFFTSLPTGSKNYTTGYASVRVIYVGGTQAANLIQGYNPSVATVNPGYVYALSANGDFIGGTSNDLAGSPQNTPSGIASIVADSSGNLYVSDNGTLVTGLTGLGATTAGNQIKKLSVTSPAMGWATYIATGPGGSSAAYSVLGDGGPATSATVYSPTTLLMDANNNLYIADTGDARVRVVYNGGATPPLYNATGAYSTPPSAVITAPVAGDIYTVVGGIPGNANPTTDLGNLSLLMAVDGVYSSSHLGAARFNPYSPVLLGLDPQGNLLVGGKMTYNAPVTNTILYRITATTGTVSVLGGVDALNTTGTISAAPGTGVYCGGGTIGPTMTDAYGDGCPAIEVNSLVPYGRIVFDSSGNFYVAESRNTSGTVEQNYGIVRQYTFPKSGSVVTGNAASVAMGIGFGGVTTTSPVYSTTPTIAYTSGGNATTEFSEASAGASDTCSVYKYSAGATYVGPDYVENCVFYTNFTPAAAGPRYGSATVSTGSTALATVSVGGVGLGAELTVDPGTISTIGSGYSVLGLGLDQNGSLYISDGTSNKIYKSIGGAAPTLFSNGTNGLKNPAQIAVSGTGIVYVANPGYNEVASLSTAGLVSVLTGTIAGKTLGAPAGVALDLSGNLYIADTGNNRIIQYSPSGGYSLSYVAPGGYSVFPFAGLNAPKGLAVDASGDLFVANSGAGNVLEMSPTGVQTTVSSTTTFTTPVGVAVDAAGDLYIADAGSKSIYLLPFGSTTTTTLASAVTGLTGVAVDSTGNVFYSATGNVEVVEIKRISGTYVYPNTAEGQSASTVFTLSNPGNTAFTTGSTLSSSTDSTDFVIAPATTNGCSISAAISAGGSCGLSAVFQPQSAATLSDTVTFPGTTPSTSASLSLSGTGLAAGNVGTTTTLSTSSIIYGQSASVTATVAPASGTTAPAGSVTLTIDGTATQTGTLAASGSNGTYTFTVSGLQGGLHSFSAAFIPSAGFTASSTTSNTPLTVSAATLTVTGVCSNRIYGQVNTCSDAMVSGYKYTDTASTVFTTAPTSTTTALRDSVAGSYFAVPANTALTAYGSNDYTISAINGSFTIAGGAVQSILFPPLPNLTHGATYQLSARTTSGLPVTYTITAGSASVSGSTLTVSGTGSITVQASSATDPTGDYAAATMVSASFTAQ